MKKVVVITGASSGIGLSIAKILYSNNITVYNLCRTMPKENDINFIECDVTKKEMLINAFQKIYEKEHQIDVVINNAGMGIGGPVELEKSENIKKIIDVNLFGVFNTTQVAIPYLRESEGKIINIGSMGGEYPLPFQAFYSATKSAIQSFSSALGNELRPFKVKVSCVMPGEVKTDFTKNRIKQETTSDTVYGERIANGIKKMEKYEQNGMSPDKIAKKVFKIIKQKNPPVVCTVGATWKFLRFLKRILPNKLIDKVVFKLYGN